MKQKIYLQSVVDWLIFFTFVPEYFNFYSYIWNQTFFYIIIAVDLWES